MKVNFILSNQGYVKNNTKRLNNKVLKQNASKMQQIQKKTLTFKGIEEIISENGEKWKTSGVAEIKRVVSYHPFLDEDVVNIPQNKVVKYSFGKFAQKIVTKTIIGERLPFTKEESKGITYDVMLKIASRLKKQLNKKL